MATPDPFQDLLDALHATDELPPEILEARDRCGETLTQPVGVFASAMGELLAAKDSEIAQLKAKLGSVQWSLDHSVNGWSTPRKIENSTLPEPRLELRIQQESDHQWSWLYMLVYRHYGKKTLVGIVLGRTETTEMTIPEASGRLSLPIRDGIHISFDMRVLGLPAFVTYKDRFQAIEPMGDVWFENVCAELRGRAGA